MFPLPLFRTFVSPLPQYVTSHPQKVGAPSCLLCRTGLIPHQGGAGLNGNRMPSAFTKERTTNVVWRHPTAHSRGCQKNKRIFTLLHGHTPEWIPNGHRRRPSRGGAQASFNGVTHAKKGMGKKKHLPYVAFQYGCRPIPDPLPRMMALRFAADNRQQEMEGL